MERSSLKWIQAAPAEGLPKSVQLSPLDVYNRGFRFGVVLAFANAPEGAESMLEHSLSAALSHCPEFAGRLGDDEEDRSCVHLSNQGVAFVTAKCEQEMLPYLEQHGNDIGELLASHSSSSLLGDYSCVPLLIQVTRFRCGGLTLGLERDHEVCDGTAGAQFYVDWSLCARIGSPSLQVPLVHSRSVTMPRQPPRADFDHPEYETVRLQDIPNGSATTTVRIHFSLEEVARLKAQAGYSYSTFVSLSALLWKNLTKLRVLRPESELRPLDLEAENAFVFMVDGRRSLSAGPGFFGNAVFNGMAVYTGKQLVELPLSDIAEKVYASVKSTLKEERMRSAIDYIALHKQQERKTVEMSSVRGKSYDPHLVVTSWTRFPFYDIDFGFGIPVSVSTLGVSIPSFVMVVPSSKKDGSVDVFLTVMKHQVDTVKSLFSSDGTSIGVED